MSHLATIKQIHYPQPSESIWPGIDAAGNIVIEEADGEETRRFALDKVDCTDLTNRTKEFDSLDVFNRKKIPAGAWEVIVSNERIAFKTDYILGLLKPQLKAGELNAGQIPLNSISHLSAMFDSPTPTQMPLLLCVFYREDGTQTGIGFHSSDVNVLKELLAVLQERIENKVKADGVWVHVDENSKNTHKEALEQWTTLGERAWSGSTLEENATVLSDAMRRVP